MSLDLNVPSESLSVTVLGRQAESSRWPEQNSGMCTWQMLYWQTEYLGRNILYFVAVLDDLLNVTNYFIQFRLVRCCSSFLY